MCLFQLSWYCFSVVCATSMLTVFFHLTAYLSSCHLSPDRWLGFCCGQNGSYSYYVKCSELLQGEKFYRNSIFCGCYVFFSLQSVSFPWFHWHLGYRSLVALGEENRTVFLPMLVPRSLEKRSALLCWARWGTSASGLENMMVPSQAGLVLSTVCCSLTVSSHSMLGVFYPWW